MIFDQIFWDYFLLNCNHKLKTNRIKFLSRFAIKEIAIISSFHFLELIWPLDVAGNLDARAKKNKNKQCFIEVLSFDHQLFWNEKYPMGCSQYSLLN